MGCVVETASNVSCTLPFSFLQGKDGLSWCAGQKLSLETPQLSTPSHQEASFLVKRSQTGRVEAAMKKGEKGHDAGG